MIKNMFPVYMIGSRKGKGKENIYIFFICLVCKRRNMCFFSFIPLLSGLVSKMLIGKIVIFKTFLFIFVQFGRIEIGVHGGFNFFSFPSNFFQPNSRKIIPSLQFFSLLSSSFHAKHSCKLASSSRLRKRGSQHEVEGYDIVSFFLAIPNLKDAFGEHFSFVLSLYTIYCCF